MSDISISITPPPSITVQAGVDETTLISAGVEGLIPHNLSHISGGSDAIDHNDLSGLQGGSSSERYHLTKAQYDSLGGDESFDFVSLTGDETISGIKTFDQRPLVNGTGIILSGEAPENVVYQTGDQTISGTKTFFEEYTWFANQALLIGSSYGASDYGLYASDGQSLAVVYPNNVVGYGGFGETSDPLVISGNEVLFLERPTVNGVGVLLSGEASSISGLTDIVRTTGSQTISGTKSFASTIKNIANSNNPVGSNSFIGGGQNNSATTTNSFIGGGQYNTATAANTAIAGGASNNASSLYASIGGGQSNIASQTAASVGGGQENNVFGSYSNIGGGFSNKIFSPGLYTVVAGGIGNTTSGLATNINGGQLNSISSNGYYSNIGGGSRNRIFQDYSVIAGGRDHISSGSYSFIAGGRGGRIPSSDAGASVLADGQDRDHNSKGAHTISIDFASGTYVSGALYVNNTGVITENQTGQFYASNNPSGYITGVDLSNYVTTSSTGELTGEFYPLNSNPSGYITGVNLSNYVTSTQSGDLTGAFYPLNNNPSGYITGIDLSDYATEDYVTGASGHLQTQITTLNNATGSYVLDTETGNFITSSETGQFYAANNPSGYVTSTQSGDLTGAFYPLDSNPSQYITSSQTGSFLTTGAADNRYVDLTSNQTISGNKTFEHAVDINEILTIQTTGALNMVADTYSDSAGSIIRTRRARGSVASPTALQNQDVIGNFSFVGHNGTGTDFPSTASASIKAKAYGNQTATNNAAYLSFETRASGAGGSLLERLVISDDGMVGINNSSPSTQLYVQGTGTVSNNSDSFQPMFFVDGYNQVPAIRQRRSAGSYSSISATTNAQVLGNNQFYGATGASFHGSPSAFMRAVADGNFSNTSSPARIEFGTTAVGSVAAPTTRLTIGSDGAVSIPGDLTINTNTLYVDSSNNRVGIGTTSPTVKLDINGSILANGTVRGTNLIYNTGDQTISGLKTFDQRPFVNGTGVMLSGEVPVLENVVYQTGDQTISGSKTFNQRPNVSGSGMVISPDTSQIVTLTQAEYTGIPSPDSTILYIITDPDPSGPVIYPIRNVNGNDTVLNTDYTLRYSDTGSIVLTLPTSIGAGGTIYNFKNSNSGTMTISGATSGETIDDQNTYVMTGKYDKVTIQSDNSNWIII